ncbi:hypothetical protein [Erythrobacter sp. HKB08]|uniref:hypothetical protein n=1 Tax=Erythrobacter sp. HKB08 TaxID=2502843 RepID=UPI00100878EF|nr:hypothetical protein [Erythrobacter sp. HKB08]
MSLDLCGFAEGAPAGSPDPAVAGETMILRLGPHLRSSPTPLPVVRQFFAGALDLLGVLDNCLQVHWPPAGKTFSLGQFEAAFSGWRDGGDMPVEALVALETLDDGAFETRGLKPLIGKEMVIASGLFADAGEARRVADRLIRHVLLMGGLQSEEIFTGLDGRTMRITPDEAAGVLKVQR